MAQSYEKAGVNLEAGYEVVRRIKKHVASTSRLGVMGNIGAFGGMFDLSALKVKEPVLVSGTDGVGTKLKLAFEMDKHDTIGIDAVAMCVNDVLAQGAEPLVFLDYVAVGRNEPQKIEAIVAGVADGCRQAGCALVGGETAEMPGMYAEGEYDIAGFTVGVVEKSQLIDGSKVRAGDVLVGVASSGVHSNGFSLVRKIVADNCLNLRESYPELSNKQLGEVLLTPTKIYVKQVLEVVRNCDVHGISHITGGGFDENIPRILHEGQGLEIDEGSWEILPVFRFLEKYGKVAHREMFNIFNMGIGMVIALVGKGPLGDDASAVQLGVDVMDRHAEDLDAVFQRLLDGMRPAEGRQQRGVDVDDPPAVGPQQHVAHNAHIARQADQLHARGIQPRDDLPLVVGLRGILLRREDERPDLVSGSPFDHLRTGFVADHQHDFGIQHAPLAGRDDGFEVRAAAAGENRKAPHPSIG